MRIQRCLPVLAASVVLLTGCGVAGTDFHPGVAAQVGDDTITTRHVDQVTDNYCAAVEAVTEDSPESAGQEQQPLRYLAREFANDLIIRSATEQLAEEYGVEAGAAYKSNLAQLRPQIVDLTDDQRDAVLEIVGARAYYQDVLITIGGIELEETQDTEATDDDKYVAGQELLKEWVADHEVEINPKYGLEFGTPVQVDTDLSYALGETAKDGLLPEVDQGYAAALPDHLVCLD